jgi:hypothetical protein
MVDNEFLAREILGHGRYLCLRRRNGGTVKGLAALAERLGLRNEHDPAAPPPRESIAFLRRQDATPGDVADDAVLHADAVVHVFSPRAEAAEEFCAGALPLLEPVAHVRVLSGVVRPKNYTGAAMNNWAYARQVVQQPARSMPNAFLVPMNKTADWWRKDWMERHTYFLPRYDDAGRMVNEGHALATEKGISCLLRRTYRALTEPAGPGEYDFVTYFECADADVPTFHQVVEALRDTARNPEWRFVREGPTWHGRRVATEAELLG